MRSEIHTPLFSIIVPVYNVKGYLERTVESILSQSFDDFELLLVDDGSTDGSEVYIDLVANADDRISVFHQTNSGVSSARNLGLDNARGHWIVFVDGDDALVPQALQILSDCIARHPDVDLIGYNFERVSRIEKIPAHRDIKFHEIEYDCRKTIPMTMLDRYTVWGEAIRKESLGNLRFENLKNGEDVLFCNSIAMKANKYLGISAKLYLYLQRQSSAKANTWTERRIQDYIQMNNSILLNIQSCKKKIDPLWLKRWAGGLLQYIPGAFKYPLDIQRRYFSQHVGLLRKVKRLPDLPRFLKIWISAATHIPSRFLYKVCAIAPMRVYSCIFNR